MARQQRIRTPPTFTPKKMPCGHLDLGITRPFQCVCQYLAWKKEKEQEACPQPPSS